jgi:hypothetical protein
MCKRIDHQMEFGQTRQLNADVVKERVVELTANPPGTMLRLTVWMEAGVHPLGTFYCTLGIQNFESSRLCE